ncbi:myrosinase 1-like [Diorhabda carinulata]|uniref:myrosinase 1-like n=1 Tax=Diorhabda carinulata TaxID=1163345 RepID=UPI0025A0F914|nr:myrosinase 1-like [Diorhabda carinulata]
MKTALLMIVLGLCLADDEISNTRFPDEFMFGVSTSAYQIEGAWNEDDKSESIWDHMVHTNPDFIADRTSGDVACDSYHKFDEDLAILKETGVNHYRFSLSWTRILPTGYPDNINVAAVKYYKNVINKLKENGIEPVVTIYHWDLPQNFQDLQGFVNDSISDWFAEYARVCFSMFGDDVKYWITINEPQQVCTGGYGYGYFPPTIKSEALLEYQCVHNLLKAHAKAWHIYDDEFRSKQNGKVAITLDTSAYLPASDSDEDKEAAERIQQFTIGIYANPIFNGDWPEVVKTRVAQRSSAEGRSQSRLIEFTQEEIDFIKGTHDFFGLNVYTGYLVESLGYDPPVSEPPSKWQDQAVNTYQPSTWETTSTQYTKVVPWSVRPLLNWIKNHYDSPKIMITENGYPSSGNDKDDRRIYYIKGYLSNIRDAMEQDGVDVFGYTVWSIMDNFEWASGYTQKFGLYEVDFNSENRTRRARGSASFYKKVIETRCLVDNCI